VRAAVLRALGTPVVDEFPEPAPRAGAVVLNVLAAGINHLDVSKAAGTFYGGPAALPVVVGSDGVGRLADGRRAYFDAAVTPYGALAQRTLVPADALLPVPDAVDAVTAAALGNAGLAAMVALVWRARVQPGERVIVLGATGAVGRLAIQIAREEGAGRIVAAGRDPQRLDGLRALGADALVDVRADDGLAERIEQAADGGVDVIIDLLWGRPALATMQAAAVGARLVQIGARSDAEIALPAASLRSRRLTLHGTAGFLEPRAVRADAYARLCDLAVAGRLDVDLERVALDDVPAAWERQRGGPERKLVVTP
jgi:NADPH2:quinone reductase